MPFTARVNETLRITAQDLTDSEVGSVTSGALVTVSVRDQAGSVVSTASTTTAGSGDDWWIDIAAPSTAGNYVILISAVYSSHLWEAVDTLTVLGLLTVLGYTTVAIVRARLGITGTSQDDAIESVINAASREIDGLTGRFFYQLAATARYFTADQFGNVELDDLVSVSAIATDDDGDRTYETTWSATDFDLEPYNASDRGFPYTSIEIAPAGRYGFPTGRKGVRITGTWGWPSVPYAISEATVLQSVRLFKRKDAPFGLAGSPELGQQTFVPGRVDPQVASLVAPYRRLTVGAV